MDFLVLIDDWFLNKVEKICHAIQRQLGITNYGLMGVANLLIAGTVVAMATYGIFAGSELPEKYFFTHLAIQHPNLTIFFVVLDLSCAFWACKHAEVAAYNRLLRGLANHRKVKWNERFFRLAGYVAVPMSFLELGMSLDSFLYFLIFAFIVLDACDPLPPRRGKFWERLEAAFARFTRSLP